MSRTLRHFGTGAEMSRHFGTGAKVFDGHFGTGAEVSVHPSLTYEVIVGFSRDFYETILVGKF